MRLTKFLSLVFLVTLISLLYVWQQTQTVSLAYEGQRKQTRFQELLDENSVLRYNLKKNTSLVKLGSRISGAGEFEMPNSYCLVKLSKPVEGSKFAKSQVAPRMLNLASRIFGIRKQAEAKTVNSILTLRPE
jgi:hypothetical protein